MPLPLLGLIPWLLAAGGLGYAGASAWKTWGQPKKRQMKPEEIASMWETKKLEKASMEEAAEKKEKQRRFKEIEKMVQQFQQQKMAQPKPDIEKLETAPDGSRGYWKQDGTGDWEWKRVSGPPEKGRETFERIEGERSPYDIPETEEEEGRWNPYTGQWEAPPGWMSPYQRSMLEHEQATLQYYRERDESNRLQQEQQIRAQLMTQPMSWLDPRLYSEGQTPVIQPWMKPLMSQQYGIGQTLPGWTAQSGKSMPELRTPSAQLWGRMGPTAQGQYMGYQQSQSGILPQETQFRLRAGAPPSGRFSGLRWMR